MTSARASNGSMLPYGVVGRPHGLGGEVTVHPFNPVRAGAAPALAGAALPLAVSLVAGGAERAELQLVAVRAAADALLVRFAGVETRDAAAAFTKAELWVPRAALPALGAGEHYVEDLIGCLVVDTTGRERGRVRGSFWNGAQDVLTVAAPGGDELLVPAVPDFLAAVDLEARRLVVDPHGDEEANGDDR